MKFTKHLHKRGLALFMALVMCLGLLNLTAFAVEDGVDGDEEPVCTCETEDGHHSIDCPAYVAPEDPEPEAVTCSGDSYVADCGAEEHIPGCPKYAVPCTKDENCSAETHEEGCPKAKSPDVNQDDVVLYTSGSEEAFRNEIAEGSFVQLSGDIELTNVVTIAEGSNVTLDLNGYTISTAVERQQDGFARHYYAFDIYGTLTVEDTSDDQKGTIRARGVETLNGGELIVNSGTIVAVDSQGGAAIWNEGTATINGGTFIAESKDATKNTGAGCFSNRPGATATITAGTFTGNSPRTYAVISYGGDLVIEPAEGKEVTVWGVHGGLSSDGGSLRVEGGTYTSQDYYGLYVSNDSKTAQVVINGGTFTGKTVSAWLGSDVKDPVDSAIEINGGHFTNDTPLNVQGNVSEGVKAIAVKGGEFGGDVSAYCVEGFKAQKNADGKYTIVSTYVARIGDSRYETLQAAIDAAQDGDTVELLQNVEVSTAADRIEIKKSITLDGGEDKHAIICTTAEANRTVMLEGDNLTVTLKNLKLQGFDGGSSDMRGISLYNCPNIDLTVTNVEAFAKWYCLNIGSNCQGANITVDNSKLTGWCAFQLWSPATVTVTGSTLTGINDKSYDALGWNDFATFVINQEATESNVSISNSTISAVTKNGNFQQIFSIQNILNTGDQAIPVGNTISLTDCTIKTAGDYENKPLYAAYHAVGGNTIIVNGKKMYVPASQNDQMKMEPLDPVAQVGDVYFGSLQNAIDAAQDGNTVTLLADVTVDAPAETAAYRGAIEISRDITIDGAGHTITTGTGFQAAGSRGEPHVINVIGGNAIIKDLTIVGVKDENGVPTARAAINAAYGNDVVANLTLVNVTAKDCTIGVQINTASVTATGLTTSGNTWGGVNVDQGGSFTMTDVGNLNEDAKIWSEDAGTEGGSTITLPVGYHATTVESMTYYTLSEHTWGEWIETIPATEDTAGLETRTCIECGATETRPIPALGHTHTYTAAVTAPTCTAQGYTTHTCACGDSYVDSYVDATGHTWDGGVVTTQPTYVSEGVRTYTCAVCGETRTESVPQLTYVPSYPSAPSGGSSSSTPSTGTTVPENPTPLDPGTDITDPDVPLASIPLPFFDVKAGEWYRDAVAYVFSKGMMSGASTTAFEPETQINRGMIVTMLYRLEGTPATSLSAFLDVSDTEYWAEAIGWASRSGVVLGYNATEFAPAREITREQLAAILYRYAQLKGYDTSKRADLGAFTDASNVSDYAMDAVRWAVAEGLISGVTADTLVPGGYATRAQAAMILMRFCENIAK